MKILKTEVDKNNQSPKNCLALFLRCWLIGGE